MSIESIEDRVIACCITESHLGHAIHFVSLLRQVDTNSKVVVVMIGAPRADAVAELVASGCTVRQSTWLRIEGYERFEFQYSPFELCCALKPFILRKLFSEGSQMVLYVDVDIAFYASPVLVWDALDCHDVWLTPHRLTPLSDTSASERERLYLTRGVFNAGMVAVKASKVGLQFVEWWANRCRSSCIVDTADGLFVDQGWLDLVPCYFETATICRHPGVNVAYWNLDERSIEFDGSRFVVNGQQLICFHFSGADIDDTRVLSVHDRRASFQNSVVEQLFKNYMQSLERFTKSRLGTPLKNHGPVPIRPSWREAIRLDHNLLQEIQDPFAMMESKSFRTRLERASFESAAGRKDWIIASVRAFVRHVSKVPVLRRLWRNWTEHELGS